MLIFTAENHCLGNKLPVKNPIIGLALLVFSLVFGSSATAAIVYDQSPPGNTGRTSDFAAPNVNQQAQRVQLSSDASIQAGVTWGFFIDASTPTDNFTIRFYNDNGSGLPQTTPFAEQTGVAVTRVDTGQLSIGGSPIFRNTFNLSSPVALTASTPYYLSIVNNTSASSSWTWASQQGGDAGPRFNRDSDAASWNATTELLAFQLSDSVIGTAAAVPALGPASIAITAGLLALGGALVARRRKG
jgi:hypothetical protein